jgi:hypothetical protein
VAETVGVIDNRLRLVRWTKPTRVYVDAKILNVHDLSLPREAFVGYVVEGGDARKAKKLDDEEIGMIGRLESDDGEVLAILFAIEDLKGRLKRFTIVCDHESVVSEANREAVKNPSVLMAKLRETLKQNPSIDLEPLMANPAHGVVTEYVNGLKEQAD